ncbi:hypothetical protein AGABI2DRAFT_80128 [Agaricus bisporus var. bisporus H97]|uniref:hypothetical protein n=1 Tax=Agaricus bisporus var. bisporus (strain H97 / ATCC MYA-4626 / FGSC 10389) TaxID=936046 RepID=UPI00029F4E9A|nr:hypothetical protein AGABI2DRAFT_80128 [Agaricus bisporus var. bisporus H97]EKV41623.1 hypothetical protein AGABI2DRAFT_80128 [Agaricus bisporus var. bisporus H97]
MELDEDSCPEISIYIAGAIQNKSHEEAAAGAGIFYALNELNSRNLRVPGSQTKSAAELYAVIMALEDTNIYSPLHLHTDNATLAKYITKDYFIDEDNGWTNCPNRLATQKTLTLLKARKAETTFHIHDPEHKPPGQVAAYNLANEARTQPTWDREGNTLRTDYHPFGAKLASQTQANLYKLLTEAITPPTSKNMDENIRRIKEDFNLRFGYAPNTETIWNNLRKNKSIARKIREFLFSAIRETYRIGKFWEHTTDEEMKAKQMCGPCNAIESMEHILCECTIPGQNQIWDVVRKIWIRTGNTWNKPLFGEILGISSTHTREARTRLTEGRARLFQVLISEAAHTIWKLRCDRVIDHENERLYWPSITEVTNTLQHRLNHRLRMDCLQADTGKFNIKALREDLVRKTWEGLLEDEPPRGTNWTSTNRVLVGRCFFDLWSFD